jgi:hypothetical protein
MFRASFYFRFSAFVIGLAILGYSSNKASGPNSEAASVALDQTIHRSIATQAAAPVPTPNDPPDDSADDDDDPPPNKPKKVAKVVKPKAPDTKPALCELGYLDSFYHDLKHGVCLGDYLINPDSECWTFKPVNLATGAISVVGYGTIGGPMGWILGGVMTLGGALDTSDNYGDKKGDSEANAIHNATKFIRGSWRCKNPAYRYMMLRADIKVDDQTLATEQDDIGTKEKLCEPFYSINRKVLDFLNLQNKHRDELLCGEDKVLRDYYWKLTEEYRLFLTERASAMTALRCYDNGSGFAFTIQSNKTNNKTHYHVELTPEGHYKGFYSWLKNPKDDPSYEDWKKWLDRGGEMASFNASADEKALAPGRSHFRFVDGPDGMAKLDSVGYLEHTGALKMGYHVRYAPGSEFLEKRPLAPRRPFLVDVDKMRDDYVFFSVWADKAKSCCLETDAGKKAECLNKWPRSDSN